MGGHEGGQQLDQQEGGDEEVDRKEGGKDRRYQRRRLGKP